MPNGPKLQETMDCENQSPCDDEDEEVRRRNYWDNDDKDDDYQSNEWADRNADDPLKV